jgi:hypothetical protein
MARSAGTVAVAQMPRRMLEFIYDGETPRQNPAAHTPAMSSSLFRSPRLILALAPCAFVSADPDDLVHGTVEPIGVSGIGIGQLRPAPAPPIVFASFGDYGVSGTVPDNVASMVKDWLPDFIVTTGDNNYGSLEPDPVYFAPFPTHWSLLVGGRYGSFMLKRTDNRYPEQTSPVLRFFPCVGNHDSAVPEDETLASGGNGGTLRGYLTYFHANPGGPPRLPLDRGAVHNLDVSYYAFRRGPVDVFVLDSDAVHKPGLIEPQLEWLAARIAESEARWKIAVFHQPTITSSFRGGYTWMQWDELRRVDAILCGHDHFYERLDYTENGPPLFITGAGGAALYPIGPPHAQSRFQFGDHHGAMRIVADDNALICEFRAVNTLTGTEDLVDQHVIGTPVENDAFDDYSFYGESGLTVHLETGTPNPDPEPLDPSLQLIGGPHRGLIAEAAGGHADGRNVRLTHRLTATGRFIVRLRPEGPGAGHYTLEARFEHPAGHFTNWRSRHFTENDPAGDALVDPDADQLVNFVEYALGLNPLSAIGTAAGAIGVPAIAWRAGFVRLVFDLPAPLPIDVIYLIEASTDLGDNGWLTIAAKTPYRPWQGPAGTVAGPAGPDRQYCAFDVPLSIVGPRQFFRLRVISFDPP